MNDLLHQLDPAQKEAVISTEGFVRVQAGAGTGKTRVLTTRAVYLVKEKKVDPQKITAVTFTVKAAREMAERAENMGGEAVKGIRMSTIHSLAAKIVRKHWQKAGLASKNSIIIDDDEQRALIIKAIQSTGILGGENPDSSEWRKARDEYAKECERKISRWKENGLSIDLLSEGVKNRSMSDQDFARVYVELNREMQERDLLDFSDLALKAVKLLEGEPSILAEESNSIDYLMVDEFQDTNGIQLRFIELLAARTGNLMVVGDDDQSIYGFRGSIPGLMENLEKWMPKLAVNGIHTVRLVTNRRCTEEILKPANLLVDYNQRLQPKVLNSGRNGDAVNISAHASCRIEAEHAVKAIANLIETGVSADEIAVLGRTSMVLGPIGINLVEKGVPHSMQAGTGFLERKEIKDILAYLKLAINPDLDVAFERIIARPTRSLGAAALDTILNIRSQKKVSFYETLALLGDAGVLKAATQKSAVTFSRHLSTLSEAARRGESSEDLVKYVINEVGYYDWALKQKDVSSTFQQSINAIIQIAENQPDFYTFFNDVCLLNESGQEERAQSNVHVGTLHGCKGLEWEHVFILGFEEGIIPNARALREANDVDPLDIDPLWTTSNTGGIEEERRLAHVGLTRAKHAAYISFAAIRGAGGSKRDSRPSRFLREAELPIPKPKPIMAFNAPFHGGNVPKGKGKSLKAAKLF